MRRFARLYEGITTSRVMLYIERKNFAASIVVCWLVFSPALVRGLTGCVCEVGLQSRAELPGAAKPKLQLI